jgi:hypothetical protein
MGEPVRGRDVQVDRFFRARCHLDDCRWMGEERASFAIASVDRQSHLDGHRFMEEEASDA